MMRVAFINNIITILGGHVCGQPGSGSCDQICLMTGSESYQCACATFGGRVLGEDKRSCEGMCDCNLAKLFTEKSSLCRNEHVCREVKRK